MFERLRADQEELNTYRHQVDQYENKLGELHQQADRRARALQALAQLRENLRILQAHPQGVGDWVLPGVLNDLDDILAGLPTDHRSSQLQMLVLDKVGAAEAANREGERVRQSLIETLGQESARRAQAEEDLVTADSLLGCLLRRLQQRQQLPGMPRHQRPGHEELCLLESGPIRAAQVHLDRCKIGVDLAGPGTDTTVLGVEA